MRKDVIFINNDLFCKIYDRNEKQWISFRDADHTIINYYYYLLEINRINCTWNNESQSDKSVTFYSLYLIIF